ncbi:MAG: GNAT family N-acetyltransferase [Alphaproteobacteria bacterium]
MAVIPTFETQRLILKGVTKKDAPSYTTHFVDYEVIRHLASVVPWPYPDGGVPDFIGNVILPNQGNGRWVWGIHLKDGPAGLIGAIDLWRPGTPENRGFWLGRNFWGKGYMSEALVPVMDHAFDALGFDAMILANAKGNDRSRRIKEKAGARLLRIEPGDYVDPAYTEKEIWELTRKAWQHFRAS